MLKLAVIGNLGNDPEMKYSQGGSAYIRFNVAGNFRTRAEGGQWEDRTEWVRVTVFGQRADSLSQYLKKGSRVFVEGRLEARPWTGQNGEVKAGLEMVADTVEFMSSRDDQQSAPRANGQQNRRQQPQGDDDGDLESLPF